jgi:hypothetical protein
MNEKLTLSPEDDPKAWVFYDTCLSAAKELFAQGKSVEEIMETLQNTQGATPEFARYMVHGVTVPSFNKRG